MIDNFLRVAAVAFAWVGIGSQILAQPPAGAPLGQVTDLGSPQGVFVPEVDDGLTLPPPVVTVKVLVPACAPAGKDLDYRIVIENRSTAAAHHVVVRDRLPEGAHFVRADPPPDAVEPELEWHLGTLAGGCRLDIHLTLNPGALPRLDNCVRVALEHGACVTTKLFPRRPTVEERPSPEVLPPPVPPPPPKKTPPVLELTKRGPRQALLYDSLPFQLIVSNRGESPAQDVRIVDSLPEGLEHASGQKELTFDIGLLRPGESRVVRYDAIAKATGTLSNRAVASGTNGLHAEAESSVTVTKPDLRLSMAAPKRQGFNRSISYRLTLSNPGSAPATNVALENPLPPQTAFASASEGGRLAGRVVRWSIGSLPPGATRTIQLKLRPLSAGEIVNRAIASADRGLTAQAEASTLIVGAPGLLLEVVDLADPIAVGADTQFNIIVRNQGQAPATNIRIEATAPPQLAIVRVQGPVDHTKTGQTVRYDPLNLPPGSDTVFRVFVRSTDAGNLRFRVKMSADQLRAGPLLEEESTTVYPRNGAAPKMPPPGR